MNRRPIERPVIGIPLFDRVGSARFQHLQRPETRGKADRWYAIRAAADVAEVLIYDEIGSYGISAGQFVAELNALTAARILVRINSPGGDVFDGIAIYNAIVSHSRPVDTQVDGLAASAASMIALAGRSVAMAEQSMLMLHRAWGVCIGNAGDMRDIAAVLDKIDSQLIDIYAKRSGKSRRQVEQWVDAESWMSAQEAHDNGLIDVVLDGAGKAKAGARVQPRPQTMHGDLLAAEQRRRRLRLAEAEGAF